MDTTLERRMARMERRLAAVENALDRAHIARFRPRPLDPQSTPAAEPSAPRPAPAPVQPPPPLPETSKARAEPLADAPTPRPAPAPAATRPSAAPAPTATRSRAQPKAPVDLERFFGLAVLGRVGVAAVLLAAGYFAQLAYKGLGDVGKVVSIYGLAAAFVGVGAWLRPKVARRYVALLWGGGAAAAYLAAVAAHLIYDLVGDTAALGMLVFASALGQFLARTLRHQTLASMALAGAFAAPIIANASLENGAFIFLYLMLLHGWSAWVERVWSWQSARIVGVVGTLVVGGEWLVLHGAMDGATLLLCHLYVLGLAAPELLRAGRGELVSNERRAGVPAAVATFQLLLTATALVAVDGVGERAVTVAPLLSGLGWSAIAALLALRAPRSGNQMMAQGLGIVGGVVAAIGIWTAAHALPADFVFAQETVTVWGSLLLAAGALALRPVLRFGDVTACVAVPIACLVAVTTHDPDHVFVLFPVAVVGAAGAIVFARNPVLRSIALWSGAAALGFGLAAGMRFEAHDPIWIAAALVATAGWASAAMAFGRQRGDEALGSQGGVLTWILALIWASYAFGNLRAIDTPLADPMTLAGLLLALAAGHAAWQQGMRDGRRGALPILLWILALALPVAAGHREMLSAVSDLEWPARDAWHTLFFAGGALVLGAIGRKRDPSLGMGALVLAGIAMTKTLVDVVKPGTSPWAAAQIAAVLVAGWALAWLLRRRAELVLASFAVFACGAGTYLLYSWSGRLPHETPFLDLRFLLGALALAGAWCFPYRDLPAALRRLSASWALLGALVLGFFVGYAELHDLVKELDRAWPDVLISVYMALYAAGTLAAGFVRRDTRLRYPALGLFGIVVIKVGLHDLATAETALRIFVTGILGLVLLGAAYAYAKRTGGDADVVQGGAPDM